MTRGDIRSRMSVVHFEVEVRVALLNLDRNWSEVALEARYVSKKEPAEAEMTAAIWIGTAAPKEENERGLEVSKGKTIDFDLFHPRSRYLSFQAKLSLSISFEPSATSSGFKMLMIGTSTDYRRLRWHWQAAVDCTGRMRVSSVRSMCIMFGVSDECYAEWG